MKRTPSPNEGTSLEARGLSVLAYVRVRPSNVDGLAGVFMTWTQPELLMLLHSLCKQNYLLRDISGRYWITAIAIEVLDNERIVAAFW